jgi:hypothetical protein
LKNPKRFWKPNFETLPSPSVPRVSLSRDKRSQYSECSGYGSQEKGVCSAYTLLAGVYFKAEAGPTEDDSQTNMKSVR